MTNVKWAQNMQVICHLYISNNILLTDSWLDVSFFRPKIVHFLFRCGRLQFKKRKLLPETDFLKILLSSKALFYLKKKKADLVSQENILAMWRQIAEERKHTSEKWKKVNDDYVRCVMSPAGPFVVVQSVSEINLNWI